MSLQNTQLQALRDAIDAETDVTMNNHLSAGDYSAVADWYNEASTFIVWKTYLSEHDIVSETSDEATTWDWTQYIATSVAEKMAWERIFNGTYSINPSIPQTRDGIAAIFSGPSNADQRAHLLAVSKRPATKAEAIYATGTGSTAAPGLLVFEGYINFRDVEKAMALP